MTDKSISATEAKNRFGGILREVSQTGGPIIIERAGKPVAVMLSLQEYKRIQPRKKLNPEKISLLMKSFGLWSNRTDINEEWLEEGRSRWQSSWSNE